MGTRALKNITITLDEKTAGWLRVLAAERGKSVSRLVGELLRERMQDQWDYFDAMRRYFSHKPFKFEFVDGTRPRREELHERSNLR